MSKKFTHFGRICVTYVLVLAIVFSFVMSSFVGLNIVASAETTSPNPSVFDLWEGNKPTSLDGLNMNGLGTKASPYEVTNPDQLWFAVNNTDATKYFKVMNDININDVSDFDTWDNDETFDDWNPSAIFAGTFDGNNKTITGLYASTNTNVYLGLFSRLGSNSNVYNVILDKAYLKNSNAGMCMVGGIAGASVNGDTNVNVFGCVVKNSKIYARGNSYENGVGGIIGGVYVNTSGSYQFSIKNCVSVDNTIASGKWKAGIIGANWSTSITLSNCFTTNHAIAHKKGSVSMVASYTTTDVTKPFDQDNNVFGDTSKVYQVTKDNMKGLTAFDAGNMDLFRSSEWILSEDNYPMPKLYRDVYTFLESDKNIAETEFTGLGTRFNPYQITNAAQLFKAVQNTDATKYFKVMNDIVINNIEDFSQWTDSSSIVDWDPTITNVFVGNFDGNQKVISGLFASSSNKYLGLFARVGDNAFIHDVIVDHAYFTTTAGAMSAVGGLIGTAQGSTGVYVYGCIVRNSKITNKYSGESGEGGLIGAAWNGSSGKTITLESCYAVDNTLANTCQWSSGLMAARWTTASTMIDCFTTNYTLEHYKESATATNCYVSGDVEYPFSLAPKGEFGATSGVYKIDNAKMKGEAALTEMILSADKWTAVENDYPMPKLYSVVSNYFTDADKTADATIFEETGSAKDPYQITNAAELWVAVNNTDATKHFKVMNDIVLNDTSNFNTWSKDSTFADWNPTNTFVGTFNGNQKTIKGLYASASEKFLGLFSRVGNDAVIYDVIVDHAYVWYTGSDGMAMTGGLIGTAQGTNGVYVYGCIVRNSVIKGKGGAAGLIGGAWSGSEANTITLKSCYAVDNTVTGASWLSGLMAARWTSKAVLVDCFTTGYPLEHQLVGARPTNCYVAGDVEYPYFDTTSHGTFGSDKGVVKIDNAAMKGTQALANMNFKAFGWTAVPDDYPMPKPYASIAGNFTAADKNMDAVTFVGTGAIDDPYQITNPAELWKAVNNTDPTKYFKVMNDIVINDISAFDDWNNDLSYEDWLPTNTFVGTFNGNQKVISGLYASTSSSSYKHLGLFSRVGSNSKIFDVIIDHAYVSQTGKVFMSLVGGLIGSTHDSTGVYVYGCIVKNSKILNSHNDEAGEGGLIGGGYATKSYDYVITVENCYAVDNVLNGTCNWSSGLFAGHFTTKVNIINCFTNNYTLAHQQQNTTVTNSYVAGDVEYPFSLDNKGVFGDTSGVYKIENDKMKGLEALDNMNFVSTTWTAVADTYPLPKPFVLEKDAWDGAKSVTSFTQLEGEGTQDSPYLITNGDELWFAVRNTAKIGIANDKIPYFRLENDIKLNAYANYKNWGTEAPANTWLPGATFVGHFDGNYKTVLGLYADPSTQTSAGLFAAVDSNSTVKNLTLDKSYIKATAGTNLTVVGGIVGMVDGEANVELSGLVVKNSILEGRGATGGIVGLIANSTGAVVVERSYAVDNTISDITVAAAAAGLVGNVVDNDDNTVVVAHSFTTSNYICRTADNAIFNNVYTTDDIAKPFADDATAFDTSVKAIALADMKGDNAITNMGLDAAYWNIVAESYPVVKPYVDPNNFKAEDKNLTLANLSGSGTQNDPYKITNAAELWVAVNNTDPTLYFKVMNDITINNTTEFAAWNDNSQLEDWVPTEKFSGYFDGNKKVISGLYASSTTSKHLGLFGRLGSEVRIIDVIIDKAYVSQAGSSQSMSFAGGLVGSAIGTSDVAIYGCVVKNSVITNKCGGDAGLGGLIGGAYSGSSAIGDIAVVNCYAVDNKLVGNARWKSGLVAARWTTKLVMTDCFTTDYPIEHQNNNVTAKNCYVSGDVEYPFSLDPKGTFGDATNVYKIDNAKMKGADALTNMNFSSQNWKATDGYPESLIKFKDNDGVVGRVWSGSGARTFAGGNGTEADPWQVDTPERLYRMINGYGSSEHWFVITADIKINDTTASDWYKSESANPWIIGKSFIGHVDGQGHTITGLYVNNSSASINGAGLFPQAKGNATITNINIDNCYFTGNHKKESYSGFLVGYVPSGFVRVAGCNVTNAKVGNANRFGGIVGATSVAMVNIDYCSFEGEKVGTNYGTRYIGGLMGDNWGSGIATNCVSKGITAIGKGNMALAAIYTDVSASESGNVKADVIQLESAAMIGTAAKSNMDKLNWKYFKTNDDGAPTAKNNVDLSTAATQGTPGKVWSGFAAAGYAGGTGTVGDPYLISTPEQLYRFSLESFRYKNEDEPVYFKITHDIYLNDVSNKNWKEKDNLNNWLSSLTMGSSSFYGHIDGDYHVIYGLYSSQNTENNMCALVPKMNGGSTISRLGFSEGYMYNGGTNETYSGAFIGFIAAKGQNRIPDGEYTPIKFTECFVDDTFEIYGYYAGGFAGGVPIGVDFVDCYSNVYIGDGAKISGAFLGDAFYSTYPDSFTNCYAIPASKWTSFSDVSEFATPDSPKKGMVEGSVTNCYYFGSELTYFDLLFYKDMYGDAAKTNMVGFDFDRVWKTVDGGSPVLRGFADADKFASTRDFYTTVKFISGSEEILIPDMEGIALSPMTLPVLEREGYFFDSWYVYEEGSCEYDYGIYPVVDTTLYAKWTANSVSQNFENYVNTKYDYDDDYVYYRPGVTGYSSMKVHGGSKAILRKGESAEEQDVILNATEPIAVGEEYKIRFWVCTDNADTKATVSLVHYTWPDFQDPNLGVEKMVDVESLEVGKWTVYTYQFKAKAPWLGIRTTGNAQLYMDDFFITPVAEFMKDASKVNDYDYFYNLGETDKNTTAQTLSGVYETPVKTLAPSSAVSTEDTNNTIAFLVTVILAASALVVLSRVYLEDTKQEIENDIEE